MIYYRKGSDLVYEWMPARKYYGPHAVGMVRLVNGHPWHITGSDALQQCRRQFGEMVADGRITHTVADGVETEVDGKSILNKS
jgi:hypothetical protein